MDDDKKLKFKGQRVTREQALEGLGDPSTWEEDADETGPVATREEILRALVVEFRRALSDPDNTPEQYRSNLSAYQQVCEQLGVPSDLPLKS